MGAGAPTLRVVQGSTACNITLTPRSLNVPVWEGDESGWSALKRAWEMVLV